MSIKNFNKNAGMSASGTLKPDIPIPQADKKLESQWNTYEANVQAYRANFLSSQSIMVAVGAILKDNIPILSIVAVIALVQIWYIWVRIIWVRIRIVDYYKYKMFELFNEEGELLNRDSVPNPNQKPLRERDYATKWRLRKTVNENMYKCSITNKKFYNIRMSRFKQDILIPIMMTIIWVSFILYNIFLKNTTPKIF